MGNKFGEFFSIEQPIVIEPTADIMLGDFTQKIAVVMRDNIDNAITGEIIKTATAEGVTALAILNKTEILKALEKQIPKKPIVDPANLCDFQNFHCPKCKQKIIARLDGEWIAGKLQNYCDKCGQALDWGDAK